MAQVHRTTMAPTKLELLTAWLPTRPWYVGSRPELQRVGGFRLDDPAGEVGIELMVVTDTSGTEPVTYLVPMTYRDAPLPTAGDALIGTSEHGVLGTRWIYDAAHDPVFAEQTLDLLGGRTQPQAQSESDTPDPTVLVKTGEFPPLARHLDAVRVIDGAEWTDLSETNPVTDPLFRLHRVLSTSDTTAKAAYIEAPWSHHEGGTTRGVFISTEPTSLNG